MRTRAVLKLGREMGEMGEMDSRGKDVGPGFI
jgi:hypothetical protein